MKLEKLSLEQYFPALTEGACGQGPSLTAYVHDNSPEIDPGRYHPAVLVCPGGGYVMTSDREAEPIALQFFARGFNAFVLRYSVAPARYPQALLEACAALSFIHSRSKTDFTHPDQIAVCGFSAGGHLAASVGVFWNEPFLRDTLGIKAGQNRPNALVLSYPVITSNEYSHSGSFDALLGSDASGKLLKKLSLENQINPLVPPVFLWHTENDTVVPVENTLLFASALRRQGIPMELHIYDSGPHGLSTCGRFTSGDSFYVDSHVQTWMELCFEWLQRLFKEAVIV